MMLRIEGVSGDCDLPGFEGWIPLLAWSWGASRDVQPASLPIRVRQAMCDKRRKALEAVGLDENGKPINKDDEEDEDEAAPAPASSADAPSYGRGRRRRRRAAAAAVPSSTLSLQAEKALAGVGGESEEEFSDSEVAPRIKGRPNVQDLSCTKFCDIATADLFALVLAQKKGVEMELRVCKSRVKRLTEEEQEANKAAAAATAAAAAAAPAVAEERKGNGNGDDDEEEPEAPEPEREYVAIQTFTFFDAFLSSVSTGGSGGEDRLTENITLTFGGFSYKFVDWQAVRAAESKHVAEKSIIFDSLRNVVKPYATAVKSEIDKSDQLQPCSSIIMQYI